jgi:hypothetical protein
MKDRLPGLLLFLPVPLVLWMFTRAPLGPRLSIALGVAVMLSHRIYARPFSLARAGRRCLWCGTAATGGAELEVLEPLGATRWRACGEAHGDRIRRLFAWADGHATALRVGILGTLALFLPAALLADRGRLGPLSYADAVAFFQLGVATSVLPLGWLALARPAAAREPLRSPFPVHIQALIGTWSVLWLFRIVGAVWLALAVVHVWRRWAGG